MQGWKRLAPLVDDVAAHHMKLVHAGLLFLATWASAIDQGASAVVTRARCFRQPSRIKQRVCLSERAFGTPIQNVPARRNEDDGGQLAAKAFAGPALSTRSCTALTHVGAFHAETDQQHGEAAGGDEYLLRLRSAVGASMVDTLRDTKGCGWGEVDVEQDTCAFTDVTLESCPHRVRFLRRS